MLVLAVIVSGVILIFLLTAFVGAPYVPTHRREARSAFEDLLPLKPDDLVLDIGSGDGVVCDEICRTGAHAVGYEINPLLVWISRFRLRRYGDKVCIKMKNFWSASFPDDTTIIYTFGDSRDIAKMYRRVESEATRLNRPLRLVSYGFAVPHKQAVKQTRAHYLYEVLPLHPGEA